MSRSFCSASGNQRETSFAVRPLSDADDAAMEPETNGEKAWAGRKKGEGEQGKSGRRGCVQDGPGSGGDRGGPGETIEAGSEWGARQRGDATEAGRGDRGGPGAGLGEGPRSELVKGRDLVSELDRPDVSEVARGCDLQPRAV